MEKRIYLTTSAGQTKKLGERVAKEILKSKPGKKAFLLGLEGDLGEGKTTFLKGFARGLGIKEKILSPTFIIMRKFKIQKPSPKKWGEAGDETEPQRAAWADERLQRPSKFENFYHIDCYRIKKPKEILNLGFKGIISNPQNIVAVEWAERIKKILPKRNVWIKFKFINKTTRNLLIKKYRG